MDIDIPQQSLNLYVNEASGPCYAAAIPPLVPYTDTKTISFGFRSESGDSNTGPMCLDDAVPAGGRTRCSLG